MKRPKEWQKLVITKLILSHALRCSNNQQKLAVKLYTCADLLELIQNVYLKNMHKITLSRSKCTYLYNY